MGMLIESFEGNGIDVTYNPTGSGSGITAVLEGRADIGLSSRALKAQEQEKLVGTDLAYDAIVVVVNKNNSLANITTEQVKDLYTGKITNWKDLGGAERKQADRLRSGKPESLYSKCGFPGNPAEQH